MSWNENEIKFLERRKKIPLKLKFEEKKTQNEKVKVWDERGGKNWNKKYYDKYNVMLPQNVVII